MKKSCKNVDITDVNTIMPWVYGCVCKHCKRYDFRHLLCTIGGMTRDEYDTAVKDHYLLINPAYLIAVEAARRIKLHELNLKPIRMRTRVDRSSFKVRQIGSEGALQQVFDHIAVNAAMPIWNRRMIVQQASSMKKRGAVYGVNMISRWLRKDIRCASWARRHCTRYTRQCRYFVKLDIHQCFPSMRMDVFMRFFSRDCGNPDLLWLWEQLLASHKVDGYEGFMIGALPSQWGAQYVLAFLYNYVMRLHSERRGKCIKWVTHGLLFMDDILLTGSSRKNLKRATEELSGYAATLGLTIKSTWQIQDIAKTPIDMMGYLIHADGNVTTRPRVFVRARRILIRVKRIGSIAYRQAQRLCSYKGYFYPRHQKHRPRIRLCAYKVNKKYNALRLFHKSEKLVSYYNKKGLIAA